MSIFICIFAPKIKQIPNMATISLSYNANNTIAVKTTLKAIDDARNKRGVTKCNSFEEYLKAVSE